MLEIELENPNTKKCLVLKKILSLIEHVTKSSQKNLRMKLTIHYPTQFVDSLCYYRLIKQKFEYLSTKKGHLEISN